MWFRPWKQQLHHLADYPALLLRMRQWLRKQRMRLRRRQLLHHHRTPAALRRMRQRLLRMLILKRKPRKGLSLCAGDSALICIFFLFSIDVFFFRLLFLPFPLYTLLIYLIKSIPFFNQFKFHQHSPFMVFPLLIYVYHRKDGMISPAYTYRLRKNQ